MRDMSKITPDTAYIFQIRYSDLDGKKQETFEAAASMEDALRKLRTGPKGPTVKFVSECHDMTAAA